MGELVATMALAQDNAFGQPLESQLRSCLLALWLCEEAGFDSEFRGTIYCSAWSQTLTAPWRAPNSTMHSP